MSVSLSLEREKVSISPFIEWRTLRSQFATSKDETQSGIESAKELKNFLLSGQFFIPLFLFLVVHLFCYIVNYGFFVLTTTSKTTKWREDIISHSISKKEFNRVGRAAKN